MMRPHPLLIGRQDGGYLMFEGYEHACLYAPTGSGKTSGFVIPNCFTWRGSLVVLDIKGEAFRATAGFRKEVLGQEVYRFDPSDPDLRTHCWNPLDAISRTSIERFDQISRQAFMLFPEGQSGQNADAFWIPSARGAFAAVAALLAESPDMPFTLAEVLRSFARGDTLNYLRRLIERRRAAGNGYSQLVVDGISDYVNGALEQVGGIRKMTSTRLQPWFNPRVAAATSFSDFDLRDLRRKPITIYVTVSPGSLQRMRPILALFFDALINLNTDKTPEEDPSIRFHTLVLLDEFARLGRMETLSEAAQYARGYGLRLAYILQNKAQIRAKYGADAAQDIFDNAGAEILFGSKDLKLTEEISKQIGDDTLDVATENRPKFFALFNLRRKTVSLHPHRRPLMLPQEVARLRRDEQIIIRAGMMPVKSQRCEWFSDPNFSRHERTPPTIRPLTVHIHPDDGMVDLTAPDAAPGGRGGAQRAVAATP